jgi:hypothetical protein
MRFFIILCLSITASIGAESFSKEEFLKEIKSRMTRVEEFKYIQKTAKSLGIKDVYLFGGTAAAYAHYVKWDLEREKGIRKLQSERFDYHYISIFRAEQDFDLVIDGTIEQAQSLERKLANEFKYFMGDKSVWEVRLLREDRGDKEALLNNYDFLNQHTDSNSTGLINLTGKGKIVKDLRDWNNPNNNFFK